MKIAYLVFAYKNPQLLKRVIGTLSRKDCTFFIHIDKKSDITEFSEIRGENVVFSEKRIPVFWAEFSGVEAILLLLRQAMESARSYDYFVLLSGSDYPLRSAAYIHRFLEENRGSEFMNLVKVPAPGKPLSRINTLRFPSSQPARHFAARALAKVGMGQRDYRKYLGNLEPYAGNTWWTLSRDACRYISEFATRNKRFVKYFEHVFAPEEAFFHTILGNSSFKSRIRHNLLFEDWSAQGSRPAMIDDRHIDLFEEQDEVCSDDVFGKGELLFARKFSDANLELLQTIDYMIAKKERMAEMVERPGCDRILEGV